MVAKNESSLSATNIATKKPIRKGWVIYVRVSTEEAAEHGHSLGGQEECCRAMCKAHNLNVAVMIEDRGHSAKNLDRPGIKQVLVMVNRAEIDGIVIWRLDRLTRSVRDLTWLLPELSIAGVDLMSVTESFSTNTPAGRMMLHILSVFAQFERESIAERIRLGIRRRKAENGWLGGPVPVGCRIDEGSGSKKLVIDPTTGPIVSQCWTLICNGSSLRDVAEYLDSNEIKPARKKGWRLNTVHNLLRQKRLVGILVNRSTFDHAHQVLGTRKCPSRPTEGTTVSSASRSERIWPLANIARCDFCGGSLFGYSAKGKSGKPYYYLRCHNAKKRNCTAPDLPADAWEMAVCEALNFVVNNSGQYREQLATLIAELRSQEEPRRLELADKLKERDGLHLKLSRLLELVENGEAGGQMIKARIQEIEQQITSFDQSIFGLKQMLSCSLNETVIDEISKAVKEAISELTGSTPIEMSRILHAMIDEVRLAHDRPIKLKLWIPEIREGPKSAQKEDETKSVIKPAQTLKKGHVLVYPCKMVEAPGIEPGSGHVRATRLRV